MTNVGIKDLKLSNNFLMFNNFKDYTIYLHESVCGFLRVCTYVHVCSYVPFCPKRGHWMSMAGVTTFHSCLDYYAIAGI